jgi:hypothetical protein
MKRRRDFRPLLLAGLAGFLGACNELPTPAVGGLSDAELETAGLRQDSTGLWRGIWRDPELDNRPFADMPLAYREFWRYCFSCHSSSGQKVEAREARRAVRLDTWREMLAYGPEKLILAAKVGGMPLRSSAKVPPEVLDRVQAYLATWSDPTPEPRLFDFQYPASETFMRTYCADCHTPAGRHIKQPQATQRLILDNYATWHRQQASIAAWIDTLALLKMPPDDYDRQPSDAERRRMLQWIDSLSPNTRNGTGRGAPAIPAGAMRGTRYDTAAVLVRKYCADCHTEGGLNTRQWDGWAAVQFDTYAQWKSYDATAMTLRLNDPGSNPNPMPPGEFLPQPTEGERAVLLEWLQRGSPNTPSGQ